MQGRLSPALLLFVWITVGSEDYEPEISVSNASTHASAIS